MDFVRKIIADHMVMSKKVSPHVTNVVEVDVTRLVHWREKNKDAFFRREGVPPKFTGATSHFTFWFKPDSISRLVRLNDVY